MKPAAKIGLGICSSVSIYKSCEIIRIFQKKGCDIYAAMTKNASRLLSPRLITALTGHRTRIDSIDEESSAGIEHIDMAREISLLAVAPATANMIGKMASGIADDFLSTLYTAVDCPVLVAPAMNEGMYLHGQTQENIQKLKSLGVIFVEPEKGYLACGDQGWGRLASPERIVHRAMPLLEGTRSLEGRTVLITAGPAREFMDPIRYLTNRSSGKMGYALAGEAVRRGAKVILVSGPTHLFPPPKAQFIPVQSAADFEREVEKHFKKADIIIMAAAVPDYTFEQQAANKLKKNGSVRTVRLVPTKDILSGLGHRKGTHVLVGFAAETQNIKTHALKKLKKKNLDLIIANNAAGQDSGFESDFNKVSIFYANGKALQTDRKSKIEISRDVIDAVEEVIEQKD